MKKYDATIIAIVCIVLAGCLHQEIRYRYVHTFWEIEGETYMDSLRFFTRDTLSFFDDPDHKHDFSHYPVTTLDLDKSGHTFSLNLRNSSKYGLYTVNRPRKELVLVTCDCTSEDQKTWIKKKSDTFTIVRLNRNDLILAKKSVNQ